MMHKCGLLRRHFHPPLPLLSASIPTGDLGDKRKTQTVENTPLRRERRSATGGVGNKLHSEWWETVHPAILPQGGTSTHSPLRPSVGSTKGSHCSSEWGAPLLASTAGTSYLHRMEKSTLIGRSEGGEEIFPLEGSTHDASSQSRNTFPSKAEKSTRRGGIATKNSGHREREPPTEDGHSHREGPHKNFLPEREIKKGTIASTSAISDASFPPLATGDGSSFSSEGIVSGGDARSMPPPQVTAFSMKSTSAHSPLPPSPHKPPMHPPAVYSHPPSSLNHPSVHLDGFSTPLPSHASFTSSTHTPAMWFPMATSSHGGAGASTAPLLSPPRPPSGHTENPLHGDFSTVSPSTEFPLHSQPPKPAGLQHMGGTRHAYNHSKLSMTLPASPMEHSDAQLNISNATNASHYSLWSGFSNTSARVTPDILAIWSREESSHGVDTRAVVHPYYSNASHLPPKGFSMAPTDLHGYTTKKGGEGASPSTFPHASTQPNTLPPLQLHALNYSGGPSVLSPGASTHAGTVPPFTNALPEYPSHTLFSSHTPAHSTLPGHSPPFTLTYGSHLHPQEYVHADAFQGGSEDPRSILPSASTYTAYPLSSTAQPHYSHYSPYNSPPPPPLHSTPQASALSRPYNFPFSNASPHTPHLLPTSHSYPSYGQGTPHASVHAFSPPSTFEFFSPTLQGGTLPHSAMAKMGNTATFEGGSTPHSTFVNPSSTNMLSSDDPSSEGGRYLDRGGLSLSSTPSPLLNNGGGDECGSMKRGGKISLTSGNLMESTHTRPSFTDVSSTFSQPPPRTRYAGSHSGGGTTSSIAFMHTPSTGPPPSSSHAHPSTLGGRPPPPPPLNSAASPNTSL